MRLAVGVLLFLLTAAPAAAQTARVYFGGGGGVENGSRGPLANGSVSVAGGMIGVKLSDSWSVEGNFDRGFRERERIDEGMWFSNVTPPASREQIESAGVFARWVRSERASTGWGAHVVWRSPLGERVTGAFYLGASTRVFDTREVRTVTSIGPNAGLSPSSPQVQPSDTTNEVRAIALDAGMFIPIRVAGPLSIAPEIRTSLGKITDESTYRIMSFGVRVLYGF